jgi:hypothetical protein
VARAALQSTARKVPLPTLLLANTASTRQPDTSISAT